MASSIVRPMSYGKNRTRDHNWRQSAPTSPIRTLRKNRNGKYYDPDKAKQEERQILRLIGFAEEQLWGKERSPKTLSLAKHIVKMRQDVANLEIKYQIS